ncbi:bifunctional 2-C-methyl-D-erythritol 4-phosphate cytidylyltransferase/2-C-methyl-D-erythritol 2,4-cyclodiphosphate synthase [Devosia sp. 919]|uniref:bifunctional 2-C-methyl-D-erythritol 4-phosphate cytidylyltransferase/2-C-methyl-D-erythritol 2,4-cyclodiphosphate synthase n=1 Tax=Devosia sp. 919 TaxID=2726065 RepID=UPI0015566CAB|nr:bifunctional 2-C-methyl-D-erythritol 4-phosphate cytidylyltransferase/2-C-methyl-D-erythritol 2,4-cyclodiphosphate synthase [Devosia sp. 919]
MRSRSIAVIVVAAGRGERAAAGGVSEPKQYRMLAGEAVLSRTLKAFLGLPEVQYVLPVIHAEHADRFAALELQHENLLPPVSGGATRQASVLEGLKSLAKLRPDYVLIQDAARPLVKGDVVAGVIDALAELEGALPAVGVTDTIKRSPDGALVTATEDRSTLFAAQTPQGFRFPQLFSAHMRASTVRRTFTDDAEIAEWAGLRVGLVPGTHRNLKITHPNDFQLAERLLAGAEMITETRVGTGFDVHPFEPGDAVWLGGVRIPHTAKLKGHSDADVALHALTDALLGAIGEGDIGIHFPPSDDRWKGVGSVVFLRHAGDLVNKAGGRIVNVDVTIVCERPRIAEHVPAMQAVIGEALGIATTRIAIKATTNERLGFIGREEGMVAMASASIELPRLD